MAAASPFPETFTDCPHCRCLCVGPTILPCGHVLCRRCLRQLLEQQGPDPTCSSCGHSIPRAQGQAVTEQLDQFCRDVVLQEVVADRIFRRCDLSCETCCTPAWTNVCLDCGTFHCIRCSENHRTEYAADCHAVVDPRKVLISASATTPRPPGREDVSQASTSLLEFQRQEVKRLEEKHSDHGRVQTDLDELIAKLQTGRDRVRKQEHLLHMYTTRMPTTINTMSMRERLRRLREEISLPTSELLQDVRCGADRLVALWDVSAHKTHAEKNNSSADCDAETVPPEYRLNIDMQNVRDVTVSQDQVEVHVWKKRKLNSCGGHVGSISSKRSTERVVITPKSTTISLDFGPVCVGHIADDVIQRTVKNVVIAKFDWAKELGRVQELKREKRRLMRQLQEVKVRGQQQLEAEKVRGQQQVAMEKVRGQQLEVEKRKAEAALAALYHAHQEEKTRERERVKMFYIGIQQKKISMLKLVLARFREKDVVSKLVQQLNEEFDVRLLAVDSGLRFLMDVPIEGWEVVRKLQKHIQKTLEDVLLQTQERTKVTWTEVTSYSPETGDAGVRLGQPLPTRVTEDCQTPKVADTSGNADQERATTDSTACGVMTAIPSRLFRFTPYSAGDIYGVGPFISAIVATQDGQQLVMTDFNNNAVKVADVTNPRTVLSVTLDAKPYRLALLRNGRVAVTAWNKRLYLIDVSGHPTVVSRVQTSREYRGVSAGTTDDTLIVSCDSDSDGPASVDVISYEGRFRHTVVDSNTLRDLQWPEYLAHVGGVLLVSDYASNSVFRVDLASGRVLATLAHPHMQYPHQVCTDPSDNVYIACSGGRCVLVRSAVGRWRRLLRGSRHGDGPRVEPYAVCSTGSRLVVTWHEGTGYSVVAGYNLI